MRSTVDAPTPHLFREIRVLLGLDACLGSLFGIITSNTVLVNPLCLARTNHYVSRGINAFTALRPMHLLRTTCVEHWVTGSMNDSSTIAKR